MFARIDEWNSGDCERWDYLCAQTECIYIYIYIEREREREREREGGERAEG
jgi:hypothetical protein